MQNRGIVIALFGLVAVAGVFMMVGPRASEGDQEAAVKVAVDAYVRAFAKGDGQTACRLLSDSARDAVAGMAARIGATDCPSAMKRTREIGGSQVRAIARKIRVGKIDVKGSTARVTLRAAGQDSVAELERVGKDWKISSLPQA